MTSIQRIDLLSRFTCLGDKCEDTCCKGWSMQVDDATLARYRQEAPELLSAVEPAQEAPWIMRKNGAGYCVKLAGGLCGIHQQYGDRMLSDACHFYPRATRALGAEKVMTATLSCPEIARLAFAAETLDYAPAEMERLPHSVKNYLPEGMTAEEAMDVHRLFLAATEENTGAEHIFLRMASVSRSIEMIDKKSWPQAVPMYFKLAEARLPAAETNPADPFNLLHALAGLIVAAKKPMSPRLKQTVDDMEKALAVTLDWENVLIHTTENSLPAYQKLQAWWQSHGAAHYEKILRRFLAMQLSLMLYPFSGLGDSLSERITLVGVRLATVKLAIMCGCAIEGEVLPLDSVVRIVQSLSRFMDHLGDPAFSLAIYRETGWVREARMRGLLCA